MGRWGPWLRRWVLPVLGLLALGLLIWFVGPLLAVAGWEPWQSVFSRALTILLLVLGWLTWRLLTVWWERRRNAQLLTGLAAPTDPTVSAAAAERDELAARFREALTRLKRARLTTGWGRAYVYQLPWYLIIGPPGSGKTTALLNAGLRFPLVERGAASEIAGVGGTRNCDWFFTDEAVLLDTAGRYSTQDSQQAVDQAAWGNILALLKQYRRRRPINGVLLAVSLSDWLALGSVERDQQAQALRQRLQELTRQLGIRFPVYVLFTKSDLIAGFSEFFADLNVEERAQVWGMTFPLDEPDAPVAVLDQFAAEFAALEQHLEARLLTRLQQERDSLARDRLYAFPTQFSLLQSAAERFLRAVFEPSRFEERPLLRGVYFTSGTQEGTPIDRLLGALAGAFRLERPQVVGFSGQGKSFFLTRLLREVVFTEAGLASSDRVGERRRAAWQVGAYVAVLALAGVMALVWLTSYWGNRQYLNELAAALPPLRAQLQQVPPDQPDLLAILPLLETARTLPGGYATQAEGPPWRLRGGLYQGDKLGRDGAMPAYQRVLERLLLPRLLWQVEARLRQPATDAALFQALKVYLQMGDAAHFDAAAIRGWLVQDWEQNLAGRADPTTLAALQAHLDTLLAQWPLPLPYAQEATLIAEARARLTRLPPAQRVYQALRDRPVGADLPVFTIAQAAGRDAALVFVRPSGRPLSEGIPGFYTLAGYRQVFAPQTLAQLQTLLAEQWVVGESLPAPTDAAGWQTLYGEVRRLYLQDYLRHWQELLADVQLRPFGSLREAVDRVNVLSGPDSPVQKLLLAVARETRLESTPAAPGAPAAPATAGSATTVAQAASQAAGQAATQAVTQAAGQVTSQVATALGPTAGGLVSAPGLAALQSAVIDPLAGGATTAATVPEALTADPVAERFDALQRLAQPQGLAPVMTQLGELHTYLNTLASAADRGEVALAAARQSAASAVATLQREASRQPPPLNQWLQQAAATSAALNRGSIETLLNAAWNSEIVPFCRQALVNRYPLVRNSSGDVTLADFGRLFAPNGLLDQYFQKYLKDFVDTTTTPWRWRRGDTTPALADDSLRLFQQAAVIRAVFFRDGGPLPGVRFTLQPVTLTAEVEQFSFDLDGQRLVYSHGPVKASAFQWPSPQGGSQVRIEFTPPLADGRNGISRDGPWSLFRLLDQAEVRATAQPDRFVVRFQLDGRQATLELRASSAFNPFRLPELEQFRCPPRL